MSSTLADKVPAELITAPQWVLWKSVTRDGKPTKLPFQPNGKPAASNDSATWSPFDVARDAFEAKRGYAGLGFVFSEHDAFCGIDLDGCRDPETGDIAGWARSIIGKFKSYAEVSPSLTGIKIWTRAKFPFERGRKVELSTAPRVCDKAPAIEVYDKLRYFAVTGQRLKGFDDVRECQSEMDWLIVEYLPETEPTAAGPAFYGDDAVIERARKYLAKLDPAVSGSGGHNATFHAACVLVIEFGIPPEQAMPLLEEYNQRCAPPWSQRELQHKLASAAKQPGPRNRLRNTREQEWSATPVRTYRDPVGSKDVESTEAPPKVSTLDDATRGYLAGLDPEKSTLIRLGLPEMDYALAGGVEPGEMLLLCARPSHGKTAIALQVAHHLTSEGMPVAIISEEMPAKALGKRVLQFVSNVPEEHWAHSKPQIQQQLDEHFKQRAKYIVIENCRTAARALAALSEAKEKYGIKFAIVDYAQMLASPGKSQYEKVTATSLALKQFATRSGITMLVLCHLSRAIESRQRFTPTNADIKDTGQLEQDADVIMFNVWPHKLNSKKDPHEFLFFVSKNRNRAINSHAFKCRFEPSRQMLLHERPDDHFSEYSDESHDSHQRQSGFDF